MKDEAAARAAELSDSGTSETYEIVKTVGTFNAHYTQYSVACC
jgi:hypothetical protein